MAHATILLVHGAWCGGWATAAARTAEFVQGARLLDDGRVLIDPDIGAACAFSQATEEDRDVWRAMAVRCRSVVIPP